MSNIKDEELARRFRQAEKLYIKAQYEKPKIKYLKTHCLRCQKIVEYKPKDNFKGRLKCPHCGKEFRLFRLDDF